MRTMMLIALGCTVFFPLNTDAASSIVQSERALREECSYDIAGVTECLEKKQRASESDLKRAEDDVHGALSKWDEDAKYIGLSTARLAVSGKAFAKYRQEQCTFAASLGGGAIGNALDMRRLACVAELNSRRAEQLRNGIADLPLR